MTLDVADEKQTGDAIQLQLAVHAAFGKAKGNGHWAGDPGCKFPGSRGPDAQKEPFEIICREMISNANQ